MIVNIGTGVATVYIAFSSSRNATLIERKLLQCKTLSIKLCHFTLNGVKTYVSTSTGVLACLSIHCADNKQQSEPEILAKSLNNMLQTCVNIANENLQAHNTGVGVKNYPFVVCINVIVQDIQCFCLHLFSLTNILENKINLST